MPGVKALRKVQAGWETTQGTAIATTTIMRLTGTADPGISEVQFAEEDVGILPGTDRSFLPVTGGEMTLGGEATFEQSCIPLACSISNLITGAVDTGGSGKVYTYTFPTTTLPTIRTKTFQAGDNQQAEQMAYCFCKEIKFSGKAKEALKIEHTWEGRGWAPGTYTTTATMPTPANSEVILFGKGLLYIDEPGGTIGGTIKSNTLLGMDLSIKTGQISKFAGNGSTNFAFVQPTASEVKLKITFEHDASSVAEKAAHLAQTVRQIRLLWTGASLTTAGTFTYKTMRADLWGKWTKFEKLDETDGNDTVSGEFSVKYDEALAKYAELVFVHQVSPLP
jgi:hypothetical protein